MPKQIDATGVVLEDLEWVDPSGKKWNIAGDVDVETVVHLFHVLQEARKDRSVDIFNKLHAKTKELFTTRHSEEELESFKIPFARLLPVVVGIVDALTMDIEAGATSVNPTNRAGANKGNKNKKKK